MTDVPCGTRDDELAAQYTLSAFAKSGGQTQFLGPSRSLLPIHV